jgi:2'-5' RNA ligase
VCAQAGRPEDLLGLHRLAHEQVGSLGTTPHPFYLPRRWVPHCTLAMHMDARAVPSIIDLCRSIELPMTGTVTEMGIARVSPTSPLCAFHLGVPG